MSNSPIAAITHINVSKFDPSHDDYYRSFWRASRVRLLIGDVYNVCMHVLDQLEQSIATDEQSIQYISLAMNCKLRNVNYLSIWRTVAIMPIIWHLTERG